MTRGAAAQDDLVIVSDLHLGAYPPSSQNAYQKAFATFVADTQRRQARRGRAWRLVLLGDVLDFASLTPPVQPGDRTAVVERTDRALRAARTGAPDLFLALQRLVSSGTGVDVVAGNHDGELVHPAVQHQMASELGVSPRDGGLRFHPWALHVPGLVYAEHGSQHHDINRIPDMDLQAEAMAAGQPVSAGSVLSAQRQPARASTSRVTPGAASVPRALLRAWTAEVRASFPPHAADLGVDGELALALWRASSCGPVSLGTRLVGRTYRRARGRDTRHDYMVAAARKIHRLLASHRAAATFYVFGHTHEAAQAPLERGASPVTYVNTGSWSPLGRGRDTWNPQHSRVPFVHVDGERRRVAVDWWDV